MKSVIFVEATPNDELVKLMRQTEEAHKVSENFRIKFISKAGIKLKHVLGSKDPFEGKCKVNDCMPCANSDEKNIKTTKCKVNNVSYTAKCNICDKKILVKCTMEKHQEIYMQEVKNTSTYTRTKVIKVLCTNMLRRNTQKMLELLILNGKLKELS